MNWLLRLARHKKVEQQLDKELRFHIDQRTADLVENGAAPDSARRQALVEFGGTEAAKEECREARGTRWLEDFVRDVQYALRTLRQKPGFAAVALITLGLGVGATTSMFNVINGVLLKPLPYAEPDRLLLLQEKTEKATRWGNLWAFAYPNYADLAHQVRAVDVMAFRYDGATVSVTNQAEYVDGFEISSNTLSVLGVNVLRGRDFTPDDDHAGGAPVALISYSLWQRFFHGDASAIGTTILFDDKPYAVIGVLPPGLQFEGSLGLLDGDPDVFVPMGQNTSPPMQRRDVHPGISVWARLHPGVNLSEARSELAVVGQRLAREYPASNEGRTFIADPLRSDVGDARSTLWLLLGAVSLVLLIACVNVASLLLARAVSRDRELAIRVALGAGRSRVIRQCLTESGVLAVCGGAFGILLAMFGSRPFLGFWPGSLPHTDRVSLDWRVLLFALGVSLLCGVLFGLAPAMRIPTDRLEHSLRAGSRSIAGSSRRLHSSFVISEIAIAVVLLVSAGVLARTLLRLSTLDPGVDIHNVLVSRMAISPSVLRNPGRTRAAWDQALANARALPGVESAAAVDTVPMREGNNQIGYWLTAAAPPEDQQKLVLANSVTPDYLKVMGISLLRGRFIADQDRMETESVAVIDEVMAEQAFPGQDPIGKAVYIGLGKDPRTVIGVVRHVRQFGLAGDDQAKVRAQLYYPFSQVPDNFVKRWSQLMSIAVRTTADPATVVPPLRQAIRGNSSDQVIYEIRTMEQLAKSSIAQQRFLLVLFGIFAGLALTLACIGIYGVLAYLTNQRVPELAIRMALGSTAQGVMRLVLAQSLRMIAAGVALGIAGAWAANRILMGVVEGARASGPGTFAVMIAVLVGFALLASYVPARRAGRVDPVTALRSE